MPRKIGKIRAAMIMARRRRGRDVSGVLVLDKPQGLSSSEAVQKAKPTGAKGTYMKKIALSSTMGPGVSLNVDNAAGN